MKSNSTRDNSVKRDLVLLFSIPLTLAALLALAVYVPQALAKPSTDFVYSSCTTYWCEGDYKVKNESVVPPEEQSEEIIDPYMKPGELVIYLYDVSEGSSKRLSEAEALKLRVDSSSVSPDGYTLKKNESAGELMFGADEDNAWELVNELLRKRVKLIEGESYSDPVKFIGWVK